MRDLERKQKESSEREEKRKKADKMRSGVDYRKERAEGKESVSPWARIQQKNTE